MGRKTKKHTTARARRTGVLDKRFQANLKHLRAARGLKQRELAEAMGWPNQNYVSQLETGIRGFRPRLVVELADYFKVDPSEFFQPEPRRRQVRIIFESLPEKRIRELRGTGRSDTIIEKCQKLSHRELE